MRLVSMSGLKYGQNRLSGECSCMHQSDNGIIALITALDKLRTKKGLRNNGRPETEPQSPSRLGGISNSVNCHGGPRR